MSVKIIVIIIKKVMIMWNYMPLLAAKNKLLTEQHKPYTAGTEA